VRTWQIVVSSPPFFPPQAAGLSGEEQVADLRHQQVPQDGRVLAALEVAQPCSVSTLSYTAELGV